MSPKIFLAVTVLVIFAGMVAVDQRQALAGEIGGASGYKVLEPIRQGNLTVFPVVAAKSYPTAEFLTLDEGLRSGDVVVTEAGNVVTRPADHGILKGITRTVLFDVIKAQGLTVEERAFTLSEAYAAREAFVTAASQIVLAVVRIDGHVIGEGKPGPLAIGLRRAFHQFAEWG